MPLRILFVLGGLEPAGAETMVVDLASALQGRGFTCAVLCIKPAGVLKERLLAAGVETMSLGATSVTPRQAWLAYRGYLKFVRAWRPQIVHSHMIHSNLLARLAKPWAGSPLQISTVHNVYEHRYPGEPRGLLLDACFALTDFLSDLNTFICAAALKRYTRLRLTVSQKSRVIYNGIDPARFGKTAAAISPDSERAFRWVAVGRLEDQKDYPNMLRAFRLALQKHPHQELMIVGDGHRQPGLERLADELGIQASVHFAGRRLDVPEILARSDAFLMSSRFEGFPISVLEAGFRSLPVVATDVGGIAEVIVAKETGYLARHSDPEALAEAMSRLLCMAPGERREMGRRARQRILQSFTLETTVGQWVDLYMRLNQERANS